MKHDTCLYASRGFTLAEAAVSTLIVGVMMVAALTSVHNTGQFRTITSEQQTAFLLGEQLMAEILAKPYADPANPLGTSIGPGSDETPGGTRRLYDDVDDYNDWLEQPPTLADGTVLANRTCWYRKVNVEFVRQENLEVTVTTDYGLKRITVEVGTVTAGGRVQVATNRRPLATVVAIAGRGRM